jgi:hypothetical protein
MRKVLAILFLCLPLFGDKINLINGVTVEGDIIGKSDVLLKVYLEKFHRAIVIERDKIESIEIDGKLLSFDQLKLKKEDYNPKFKISPRRRKKKAPPPKKEKIDLRSMFEEAHKENVDLKIQFLKQLNLFFNAPARWGSVGFGYFKAFDVVSSDDSKFREYDFTYQGHPFEVRCLNAQIRRNFRKGIGTLIVDFGYGKKVLDSEASGLIKEAAIMRFVSVNYSFCNNRWLLSPGLSFGLMLNKSGIIRFGAKSRTAAVDTSAKLPNINYAIYDNTFRPLLGLDFNLYDVVALNISLDIWRAGDLRYFGNLIFLMPFLQ